MAPPPTEPSKGELVENEKKLIENTLSGNVEEVLRLLAEKDVHVDCLDEHGMTPLQHAAFKGNAKLCQIYLSRGADVNSNHHDNGYTTLMFAALTGNTEVTRLILEAGANPNCVNSVNRTASQLAGFVGQHQVTSVINNFFSQDKLDYYAEPQGLEKEPKLPPKLVPSLYKLVSMSNLNPVKLSLYLKQNLQLVNDSVKVIRVLGILTEKMMKQADTNDIMAVKFHYLACLLRETARALKEKNDNLDSWIKLLLRGRDSDGFPQKQEEFIRSTFSEFPYPESQLLQQIIRNLANVAIGDDPTALSILSSGINGQKYFEDETACSTCGEPGADKKCSICKKVHYCNQDCQKLQWFTHKKFCKRLAEQYKKEEEARIKREAEDKKREEARKEEEAKAELNGKSGEDAEVAKQESSETVTEGVASLNIDNKIAEKVPDDGNRDGHIVEKTTS